MINKNSLLHKLVFRFLPKGTRRYQIARSIFFMGYNFLRRLLSLFKIKTGLFNERYIPEDFGYTILYTDQEDLFPDYPFREKLSKERTPVKVTLISTLKDEASNVGQWMEHIYRQSRLPDEIVLVDGGSKDGTIDLLHSLVNQSPVPLRIIQEQNVNIAKGRNIAIEQAENEIIAAIDFGCRPEPDWLKNIIAPFEIDEQMQVVSGWYSAVDRQEKPVYRRAWPRIDQIQPDSFVPSSRSVAFKKEVWEKAHHYPEWLTLTGEDTYFALELKKFSSRRAFVPDAVVLWFAPETIMGYLKKIFYWSTGDGELGWNSNVYYRSAIMLAAGGFLAFLLLALIFLLSLSPSSVVRKTTLLLLLLGLLGASFYNWKTGNSVIRFFMEVGAKIQKVRGYLAGEKRRGEIDKKRFADTKGVFVILAGVPIHDTGGGSRGAQIALELVRQNYLVIYINKFDTNESVKLSRMILHPNLLTFPLAGFAWEKFIDTYREIIAKKECKVLIEFPLVDFVPLIDQLHAIHAVIAYDLLDDWESQLGSTWYDRQTEEKIIELSDVLIATAPILADRLRNLSQKPVALLPNAVNLRLFNPECSFRKPVDLPDGSFVITYIGALWGNWFDWDLLVEIAKAYPQAAVMVIGDYRGQCPAALPNLYFLGLKSQSSLPAYLQHSDVTIIPWKVNKITLATSPLKLYEYLAMNVPVVVPDLPPLHDIPFVYLSNCKQEFIQNIELALHTPASKLQIQQYLNHHSWEYRVSQLNELMSIHHP